MNKFFLKNTFSKLSIATSALLIVFSNASMSLSAENLADKQKAEQQKIEQKIIETNIKKPIINFSLTEKEQKSSLSDFDIQVGETVDIKKITAIANKYQKLAQSWQKLSCEAKTAFLCSKKECNSKEIKASLILDKEWGKISSCSDNGQCSEHNATFKQNGAFVNIQSEDGIGILIRVLGDHRYKAIFTIGLDAYINNGECKVI
jgi:hypothetical protein